MNHKIFLLLIAFFLSVTTGFAQTLQLEAVANDAVPGLVEVELNISDFPTNIGAVSINIAIDTELLEYTGGNMTFGGGTIQTNTVDDELMLSWFNQGGISINGTFALLKFNYAGALPTDLVFNQSTCEIADVNGTIVPISIFNDEQITPAPGVGTISLASIPVASVGSSLQMPLTASAIGSNDDFEYVTSMNFKIMYNPAQLSYTGIADNSLNMTVNDSPGFLELSWSNLNPVDIANLNLLSNLEFNYLGGDIASLEFISASVTAETMSTPVAIELMGGNVYVAAGPTEGTLSFPEMTFAEANSMVTVPLIADDINDPVSIIELRMLYDATRLTYVGFTADQLNGWIVNVNQGLGTITAYYTNITPQVITNGDLLSFNFNYTIGKAELGFAAGTAMQASVNDFLNLELVDGFVNNDGAGEMYSISGMVKYANTNGAVRPINTTATTTTEVILFESDGVTEVARVNADFNGNYIFENVDAGDYVLRAETDKPWGGVAAITLADYAITRNYVNTGTPVLNGLAFLAADVNNSNTISLADYAFIKNFVNNGVKVGSWTSPDWIFEAIELTFSNGDVLNFDIRGICSGDVNASYTPPTL